MSGRADEREGEREEGEKRGTDGRGRRRGHVGPRPPSMRNNDRDRGASEREGESGKSVCAARPPAAHISNMLRAREYK